VKEKTLREETLSVDEGEGEREKIAPIALEKNDEQRERKEIECNLSMDRPLLLLHVAFSIKSESLSRFSYFVRLLSRS